MSLTRIIALCGVFSLMIGCAATPMPKPDPKEPPPSLIIGYLDMSEAPTDLQSMHMIQVKPEKSGEWGFAIRDGIFWNTYPTAGSYKFTRFTGHGYWAGQVNYSFPSQGRSEMDPVIDKPGVYFVGSYKYSKVKTGFFSPSKFNIERVAKPTEKEILERALADARDPYWKDMIEKRLKELN